MSQSNRPVTSREYKLMMNVERFKDRNEGAQLVMDVIEFLIAKEGGKLVKKQTEEEKRLTSYLDTEHLALNSRGFALRLREEATTPAEFQINLKLRSPDRYLAASEDLSTTQSAKIKFEEDVLPLFASKFSHSAAITTKAIPDLSNMGKVMALFPGLAKLNLTADTSIGTIKGFKAAEVVRKLCKFQFSDAMEIKCSLSFWYLSNADSGWPLVAELSFDYDANKKKPPEECEKCKEDLLEEFDVATVRGANRLFIALQAQTGWLSNNSTSKTAFALDVL